MQRRPSPELQRLGKPRRRCIRIVRGQCAPAFSDEELELTDVDLFRSELEHVSGRLGHEDVRVARLEQLPNSRDEAVEGDGCGGRWAFPPQTVEQPIGRDDAVRVEREQGNERALLPAAEREHAFADRHLDRPKEPDLEPGAWWLSALHSSSQPGS